MYQFTKRLQLLLGYFVTWEAAAWAEWAMAPTQNFGWVGHNAFCPTNNWSGKLVKLVPSGVGFLG